MAIPAIIQFIMGEAALAFGNEAVAGQSGRWIQAAAKTPRSMKAESPVVLLLTLLKRSTYEFSHHYLFDQLLSF